MVGKNLPYISIIVTFYNIEECVGYCLDSLVAQDYEGEFEVLCIDDGSTDGTPQKLDAYAAEKPNVKVLHKPNGGISDARNFGVEHAEGDYISFVDGDDVVSPYYLSSLALGLRFGKNVMVAGVQQSVNLPDVSSMEWQQPEEIRPVDKAFYLREICFQRMLASVCARLARKDFFLKCPNPTDRVYEDTYVTSEYVDACSGIVLVKNPIYGYVARAGSIVHPNAEDLIRCLQHFEAIDKFCGAASGYFSPDSSELIVFRSIEYSRLWRRLDVVVDFPDEARARQRVIQEFVGDHLAQLKACSQLSKGNKARLHLLAKHPMLYRMAFAAYDGLIRKLF